jgi:hypothetical protein
MMTISHLQRAAAGLAVAGLLLPPASVSAAPQQKAVTVKTVAAAVADVALTPQSALRGRVVDHSGAPQSHREVVVRQGQTIVARTSTDRAGEFTVANLKGGAYEVASGATVGHYRLWTDQAAPPKTGEQALLVLGENGARGQFGMIGDGTMIIFATAIAALILGIIALDEANENDGSHDGIDLEPSST